jgi:hypothetical protein
VSCSNQVHISDIGIGFGWNRNKESRAADDVIIHIVVVRFNAEETDAVNDVIWYTHNAIRLSNLFSRFARFQPARLIQVAKLS